jgi:fatty-acyl-CoA synthase
MNMADWIDRRAVFTPNKTAIQFVEARLSYGDMAQQVATLAGALRDRLGIRAGDRVVYVGYNTPEMLVLLFACARIGAILLPLNWRLAAAEHRTIVNDCTPSAFFARSEFLDVVDENRDQLGAMQFISYAGERDGWVEYENLMAGAEPISGANSEIGLDAPILLCYTSGTTGKPKGVILDQNALFYAAVNSTHMHDLTSQDRVLSTLPMFHVGGLNIQTIPALHAGATVYLHEVFDPQRALDDIRRYRITLTVLVPAQMVAIMSLPGWVHADLSSLRVVSTGSTLVPHAIIEAFHARNVPVIQVYGSTETSPIATFQIRDQALETVGSAGKPAVHCEMRVVDDSDNDVAEGESGEILIRGPSVMTGYWNNPEATNAALKDGWYYTGDVGYVDAQGNLYVNDRKKDMIISGGENIYPAELENLLAEFEAIAESAVVGRADLKWGEIPVVVAVAKEPGALRSNDVMDYFNGKLARYKLPRDVLFVDALPRNSLGKIQKHIIREMVANKH